MPSVPLRILQSFAQAWHGGTEGRQVEGEATFLSCFHLSKPTHLPPPRASFINDSKPDFQAFLTEKLVPVSSPPPVSRRFCQLTGRFWKEKWGQLYLPEKMQNLCSSVARSTQLSLVLILGGRHPCSPLTDEDTEAQRA